MRGSDVGASACSRVTLCTAAKRGIYMRAGLLAVLLATLCGDLYAGCESHCRSPWRHCAECGDGCGQPYDYRASFNYPWDRRRGPAFGPRTFLPYETEPRVHVLPPHLLPELSEELEGGADPRIIRIQSTAVSPVASEKLGRKPPSPAVEPHETSATVLPAAHHQRAPEACEPPLLSPQPTSNEHSVLRFLLDNSDQ